jgi:hypothetical protein
MSNAWDMAKQMAERHSSSNFVRLANDGDKVVGVFVGEPFSREVVWTGEKYLDVKNPEAAKYLKKGRTASVRVAMNFYILAERVVRVYEMGAVVFKDVYKLRDKYGLDTWAFEIERHGGKGDNKTSYTILPEQRLDDAMRREIAQLELHDLEKVLNNSDTSSDGDEQSFDSYHSKQEPTIDDHVKVKLLPRLKRLPRDGIDQFLQRFNVVRLREIKASDEAAAFEFLSELEERMQPPQEIDPFS